MNSIRIAINRDIPAITALLSETDRFHQPFDTAQIRQGPPAAADREQLANGLVDPNMRVIVCELGQRIVGYARMEIKGTRGNRLFRPMRLGVVHEVAVAETHRGVGVGKALMETLHDQARAARVERIQLEHYAANVAAGALYARLGYEPMRMILIKDL